jgi:hypothetical protein
MMFNYLLGDAEKTKILLFRTTDQAIENLKEDLQNRKQDIRLQATVRNLLTKGHTLGAENIGLLFNRLLLVSYCMDFIPSSDWLADCELRSERGVDGIDYDLFNT